MQIRLYFDTVWVLLAAMLVLCVGVGLTCIQAGLSRKKNVLSVFMKNISLFAVSFLLFYLVGWKYMFGSEGESLHWSLAPVDAKFFFQFSMLFISLLIVSGAGLERIKYLSLMVLAVFMSLLVYPLAGQWIWGGGWLQKMGFWDYAGSTAVHAVGGWAALAVMLVLGARNEKKGSRGVLRALKGHDLKLAAAGTILVWFGWIGLNSGNGLVFNPYSVSRISIVTLAAASGGWFAAAIASYFLVKKADFATAAFGSLGALVAISASCAFVSIMSSILIGAASGLLTVLFVVTFERMGWDDPLNVISVHLVNGVFGTIVLGLFAEDQFYPDTLGNGVFFGGTNDLLVSQLVGTAAIGLFSFSVIFIVSLLIKWTYGLRVSLTEEMEGLDLTEHGEIVCADSVPYAQQYRHIPRE